MPRAKASMEFIQIKFHVFVYGVDFYIKMSSAKLSQLEECISISSYDLPLPKCLNCAHNCHFL